MKLNVNYIGWIDFDGEENIDEDRIINLSVTPVNSEWINLAKELDEDYESTCFNVQVNQNKQTKAYGGFECFYLTGYDSPTHMGVLTENEQKICVDYINSHIDEFNKSK